MSPSGASAGSGDDAWSEGRRVPSVSSLSGDESERERDTAEHPLRLRHPDAPDAGDHEEAQDDEEHAAGDVHGADVAADEGHRKRRPPEAERAEEERAAEAQ